MSRFSNPKLPWTIAAVLLLTNLALLTFLWLGKPPHPPKGGPDVEKAVGLFKDELNLDARQEASVRTLVTAHFAEMKSIHEGIEATRKSVFEQVGKENSTVAQQLVEFGTLNQRQISAQFKHFNEVRALCNPEQQIAFDALLPKIVGRERKGPKGNRPPR